MGNLSTGGTGKSPMTEYLIRLLSNHYKVATLSRGYKRKSIGFQLADANANADILGDEPYQFHRKFPDATVAVDADRKNGIERLLSMSPKPNVIVLDDAYQHRRVKAGFYIFLTAYGDLYADDYILPSGNLREGRSGAKRANAIIVTKCPPLLSDEQRIAIRQKLKPSPGQQLFFSYIDYDDRVYSGQTQVKVEDILQTEKILVSGIANPKPFFAHLHRDNDVCLTFPDHHYFTDKEIETIEQQSQNKIIITTEKDFMRLEGRLPADRLFYLPIKSSFVADADNFDKTILDYVGQSTGDS